MREAYENKYKLIRFLENVDVLISVVFFDQKFFRKKPVKELLPTQPIESVSIDSWWLVNIGYITEDDIKVRYGIRYCVSVYELHFWYFTVCQIDLDFTQNSIVPYYSNVSSLYCSFIVSKGGNPSLAVV